ncbi:hypothetical protein Tco_1057388 [Tanacetum coccineum]|uniref:Uncharacterized protein n=1 Tax=Tanacetum coccineum TaxID=301880 RepID=A0ABQ5H5C8_9ASTR
MTSLPLGDIVDIVNLTGPPRRSCTGIIRWSVSANVDAFVGRGENGLLRHKAEMVCHEKVVKMPWKEMDRKFSNNVEWSKENISRCGRNQMGNEPILALPEGADDFVVYYDARSKDLKACLEKGRRTGSGNISACGGVGFGGGGRGRISTDVFSRHE